MTYIKQAKVNGTRFFSAKTGFLALIAISLVTIGLPISFAGADTGSSIAGTVTDAANPSGLLGVCVNVSAQGGAVVGTTVTLLDGSYEVDGLSNGVYVVQFDPSCSGTLTSPDVAQYWDDEYTVASATPITVGTDDAVIDIDATLAVDALAGTITDAADPGGLSGVCVTAASSTGGGGHGTAVSAANGSYSIEGLPDDSYAVEFDPSCQGSISSSDFPQWYLNATTANGATPVSVTSGNVTIADASLLTKGSMSGTVTDAFHPSGLANICISATSSDGGIGIGSAITASDGTYTVSGLPPDNYTVNFDPTCSGSVSSHDVAKSFGSAVAVASGANTPNINAVLATIPGISTNVVVSSSINPAMVSDFITYYATVSPTDNGGKVAFSDYGQVIVGCSAQTITANVASCPQQSYSQDGTQEITAAYSGDEGYGASNSTEYGENIQDSTGPTTPTNPVKTTIVLTSSANPAVNGSVTYTAVVSPTDNKGTVNFYDAPLPIAACQDVTFNSGTATCEVTGLTGGSHQIVAVFSGVPGYDPSTSSTLFETVPYATATTIVSSFNPAGADATIKFVATTSPGPDGGTLSFAINGSPMLRCADLPMTNGVASCQLKNLHPGDYAITAAYSGDSRFTSSTGTFSESVRRSSAITVTASRGVTTRGKTVHFSAKVAKKYGSGFVTFTISGQPIKGCAKVRLRAGVGVCSDKHLSVGRHIISAAFSGNARFGPSYGGVLEIIKK